MAWSKTEQPVFLFREDISFYFQFEALQKMKSTFTKCFKVKQRTKKKIATKTLRYPMTWNEWTIQRFNFFIPLFILSLHMIKAFKKGASKICGRNFTWSILEYFDPYIMKRSFGITEWNVFRFDLVEVS